jgi:hypothetical protein
MVFCLPSKHLHPIHALVKLLTASTSASSTIDVPQKSLHVQIQAQLATNFNSFQQCVKAVASDMLHEADREVPLLIERAIEPDQFHRQVWLRLRKRTINGEDVLCYTDYWAGP